MWKKANCDLGFFAEELISNWYITSSFMLHFESNLAVSHMPHITIFFCVAINNGMSKKSFFPCHAYNKFQKHFSSSGMPMELYNIWFPSAFPFGEIVCVLQGLFSETSTNATILTITSFTCERYIAICHPFRWENFLYTWDKNWR